jgi:Alternative complex III, ActD subunit
MAERVFAIFDTAKEAVEAAEELRFVEPNSAVSVLSSEPIHSEIEKNPGGRKSRIGLFAIAGGVLGATAAILLTVITSKSMNLVTGGMPVVAPWAFGIIVFEMTALGAVLSTLGRMAAEAGLMRRALPVECDNAVAEGRIAVVVDVDSPDVPRKNSIEEVLVRRGAEVL